MNVLQRKTATPASSIMPVAQVLDQVGSELFDIARLIEQRLKVLSPLLCDIAAQDRLYMREFQEFDLIEQKLRALSDFLKALAPALPGHWALDPSFASQRLTLAALSLRLTGSDGLHIEDPAASGDFEMF